VERSSGLSEWDDLLTETLSLLLLGVVACLVSRSFVLAGVDSPYFDRRVQRFDGLFSDFLSIGNAGRVMYKGEWRVADSREDYWFVGRRRLAIVRCKDGRVADQLRDI